MEENKDVVVKDLHKYAIVNESLLKRPLMRDESAINVLNVVPNASLLTLETGSHSTFVYICNM